MDSTHWCIAALALFTEFGCILAVDLFPENNPRLGIYQNEGNCFPFRDDWYIIYRSFQCDPNLGGNPTCVAAFQTGPFENSSGQFGIQVGNEVSNDATVTLLSSPGYEVQNVINVAFNKAPEVNYDVTGIYTDCDSCEVLRHNYADGGKGCALWQPKRAIGTDINCCQFVYDLVCGTGKKYQLYDKCEKQGHPHCHGGNRN
ncbi:uncharacterized protein LOC144144932 [Haemaphysalis longicornis]